MTIALGVALLAVLAPSVWLLRLRWRPRGSSAALAADGPDLLEVAYLLGGAGRVVDTVITRMHTDGRITVADGKVTVTDPATEHSLERALLKRCDGSWKRSLRQVRRELRGDPALEALHRSLVERKLLMTSRTERLWPRVLVVQTAGLAVAAVIALASSSPWSFAVFPVIVAGVVVRVVCRRRHKGRIPCTEHGRRIARKLRYDPPWSMSDPEFHHEGAAGVVAVRGTGSLHDAKLREEFEKARESGTSKHRKRRATSSGNRSSSGSSSSTSAVVVGASCDAGCGCGVDSGGSFGDSGGSSGSSGSSCSSSSCSSSSCSSSSCSSSSCS
ncbi:TIGR04222 domain-containing membrane protein [Streptomyces gamaensis]|uniref:TIGR04222 domain-containing membrane protein n=1 Tax=Streptomyces gamaensis TaxID=1763542 RepID=A0ABW0Z408_9ACTN